MLRYMMNKLIAQDLTQAAHQKNKEIIEGNIKSAANNGFDYVILFIGLSRENIKELMDDGYCVGYVKDIFGSHFIKISW